MMIILEIYVYIYRKCIPDKIWLKAFGDFSRLVPNFGEKNGDFGVIRWQKKSVIVAFGQKQRNIAINLTTLRSNKDTVKKLA